MNALWNKTLMPILAGMSIALSIAAPLAAYSEDADTDSSSPTAARKMLYLFSMDFPPSPITQYPSPPIKETRFWQLLDKEMGATSDLTLTENQEEADYRVELRCSGVVNCSKLIVDVKSPKRDVLTTFTVPHVINPLSLGLASPNLANVAKTLTNRLDERIKLLDQGGYGYAP